MKKELASKYDHKSVEKGKYQHWLEKEYFKAGDVSKKPYANRYSTTKRYR